MVCRASYHSISIALLTSLSSQALSQASATSQPLKPLQEEIKWLQEEAYVPTATKTRENIKKSGASVSVITAVDLKRMGARNLMDALKRVPGLGVYQTNIGRSTLEVRGLKTDFSEKVLFLINGHPNNNNLVNGGALSSYNNFIIDDISRVEVVRGPGSALYGANAFAAVINIITKSGQGPKTTTLTAGVESNQTKKINASYKDGTGPLKVAANLNIHDSEGFKGYVDSDAILASGEIENWIKRYELGFKASYENWNIQGKYLKRQSGAYLGANNIINDDSKQEYIDYFLEAAYQYTFDNNASINTNVYVDHFQFDNLWEIFPEGFTDSNNVSYTEGLLLRSPIKHARYGTELQIDYQPSERHKVLSGVMLEHQSQYDVELWTNNGAGPLQNSSSVANWNGSHDRDIVAVYIQDIWDINNNIFYVSMMTKAY